MARLRPLLAVRFAGCLALAVVTSAPAVAEETAPAAGGSGAATPAAVDAAEARIKYLHDRLRITAVQEPLWEPIAQAIRDNARKAVPLLKERLRATTNGSAVDVLHAYESLGETQLEGLRKLTAVFEPFYGGLPDNQKKIADAVIREGAQNSMIGGIPIMPPPLGYSLAYPGYPGYWVGGPFIGGPFIVPRPFGLHRFHSFGAPHLRSFASPGTRFGGFHR